MAFFDNIGVTDAVNDALDPRKCADADAGLCLTYGPTYDIVATPTISSYKGISFDEKFNELQSKIEVLEHKNEVLEKYIIHLHEKLGVPILDYNTISSIHPEKL